MTEDEEETECEVSIPLRTPLMRGREIVQPRCYKDLCSNQSLPVGPFLWDSVSINFKEIKRCL